MRAVLLALVLVVTPLVALAGSASAGAPTECVLYREENTVTCVYRDVKCMLVNPTLFLFECWGVVGPPP